MDVKAPASGATDPARRAEHAQRSEYRGKQSVDQDGDPAALSLHNPLSLHDRLRGRIKCVIVTAACWGFSASLAEWLIQRGGLSDA